MALRDIIVETQTDLLANPDHAIATFSVNSRQVRRVAKRNQNPSV